MAIGPGKHDALLERALQEAKAEEGILLILDKGNPGFSARLGFVALSTLPKMLREMADQIERDYKNGQF